PSGSGEATSCPTPAPLRRPRRSATRPRHRAGRPQAATIAAPPLAPTGAKRLRPRPLPRAGRPQAATTPTPLLSWVASTAAPSRTAMHPFLLPPSSLFPQPAARRRATRTHHRSKQRPTTVSSSAACAWRGQQRMSARPWPSNRPAPIARRRTGPTRPAPSRSSPQGPPPLRGRLAGERLLLSSLWQLCKRGVDCFFFLDLRVCM
uniref:Uncharacterized protein n=1 Tax=Aegilops tauschii subsp. strangulata TaxID=200361 RepID=A0A453CEM0_AEGTS